jgi:TonB family protein
MTTPTPTAKRAPKPNPTVVKNAPDEARGQTPTRGAEPASGSAVAATGARGQGFGLSTGGGMGTGSRLDITGDFCCPDYILLMVEKIRSNWNQRVDAVGETVVMFTIQRDGRITNFMTERSSGFLVLDNNALRAVAVTRELPPLPEAFTNPTLPVHLTFQYTR